MLTLDVRQVVFLIVLLICTLIVLLAGGRDERLGLGIVISGSVLSWPAVMVLGNGWHGPELALALVDGAALILLLQLALRSDRFWPLWATGFHAVATCTIVARLIGADASSWAYSVTEASWTYPIIALLLFASLIRVPRFQTIARRFSPGFWRRSAAIRGKR